MKIRKEKKGKILYSKFKSEELIPLSSSNIHYTNKIMSAKGIQTPIKEKSHDDEDESNENIRKSTLDGNILFSSDNKLENIYEKDEELSGERYLDDKRKNMPFKLLKLLFYYRKI